MLQFDIMAKCNEAEKTPSTVFTKYSAQEILKLESQLGRRQLDSVEFLKINLYRHSIIQIYSVHILISLVVYSELFCLKVLKCLKSPTQDQKKS